MPARCGWTARSRRIRVRRWPMRWRTAVPTAAAHGVRPPATSCWSTPVSRSSIRDLRGRSRWRPPTAGITSCSTARSTIREQGWAMQDEELAYGLRSVAAPITAPDGRVAGRRQPGRPGPRLVDPADHPRAQARRAGHLRGDLSAAVRHHRRLAVTSGARLPKFEPPALDAEQRSLYDAIAGGRRAQGAGAVPAGRPGGPAGGSVQRLPATAASRGRPSRPWAPRCATHALVRPGREIAILVVGRHRLGLRAARPRSGRPRTAA